MLFKLLLPYLRFGWDSLDLCELASKEVNFSRFRANPCSSVGHNFPLIAPIYTDIPCFRVNPCPSVVGIIPPCASRRNLNYLNIFS